MDGNLNLREEERFEYEETKRLHRFTVIQLKPEWKMWYKTIGKLYESSETEYIMEFEAFGESAVW